MGAVADCSRESAPSRMLKSYKTKSHAHILHDSLGLVAVSKPPRFTSRQVLDMFPMGNQQVSSRSFDSMEMVSRLDYLTSGVLVVPAGGAAAKESACAQFAGSLASKEYLCLCASASLTAPGTSGWIESCLRREKTGPESFHVSISKQGRRCSTFFVVLARYLSLMREELSLVLARPATGFTHQIRVHMASVGGPLVADNRYNPSK